MVSTDTSEPDCATAPEPAPSIRQDSSLSSPPAFLSSPGKLSPAQIQVAIALAEGKTTTAAASQAGVHRTTVHHWLRTQPDFKHAVEEAQAEYHNRVDDDLTELAAGALSTLRSLLEDPQTPHSVRLKAALAILERPRFPQRSWTLPTSAETPNERHLGDQLAFVAGDYKRMRMADALEKNSATENQAATDAEPQTQAQPAQTSSTPPRNAPCPCGSGLKYKRCCAGRQP